MDKTLIDYFFKQAEIGNWDKFTIDDAIKKLKLEENEFKTKIPNKEAFLKKYNMLIDKQVLNEIDKSDLESSEKHEVLQEFLMSKLEKMTPYKLAIANLLNYSITKPRLILLGIKSNKESIKKYIEVIQKNKFGYKEKILTKLVLGIWLLALNKWLYADNNETSYAIIDKSIKRIKKILLFFTNYFLNITFTFKPPSLDSSSLIMPECP